MNFKIKKYLGHKCLVTFLSLLMVSNINLTYMPEFSASNSLPEETASIKSEERESWWEYIASRPKRIITGTLLGCGTLAALVFGKIKIDSAKEEALKKEEETRRKEELVKIEQEQAEARRKDEARRKREEETQRKEELARIEHQKEEARRKDEARRRREEEQEQRRKEEALKKEQEQAEARRKDEARRRREEEEQRRKKEKETLDTVPSTAEESKPQKKPLANNPAFTILTNVVTAFTNTAYKVWYFGSTPAEIEPFDAGELGRRWMSEINPNAYFHQMLIPGSHDSGTYPNYDAFIQGSSFAITQTLNIYQQLNQGVRCLDFRIRSYRGEPYIYHGQFACTNVKSILNDLRKFITENPSEVIFIKMEMDPKGSKCDEHGLELTMASAEMELLKAKCLTKQDLPHMSKRTLSDLTLEDMRKAGRNIIIISDYKDDVCHKSENLISRFDSKSRTAGTNVMVGAALRMLNEQDRIKKLHSISPIHTADFWKIIKFQGSPIQQELYYSSERNHMLWASKDFHEKANMVSLDHIAINSRFICDLILLNRERGIMR